MRFAASIARPSQSSALDVGGGGRARCWGEGDPVIPSADFGGPSVVMVQQLRRHETGSAMRDVVDEKRAEGSVVALGYALKRRTCDPRIRKLCRNTR